MPKPKISAALNNCPLHILTGHLSETFTQLAIFEHNYSERYLGQDKDNPTLDQYLTQQLNDACGIGSIDKSQEYLKSYQMLKKCFSNFYELEHAQKPLTFQRLSSLFKTFNNKHDQQIIIGPVMRVFLQQQMASLTEKTELFAIIDETSPEEFIQKQTTIQDNGRYDSLSDDLTAAFIAQPLGIELIINKSGQPPRTHELMNAMTTLNVYHEGGASGASAGGHWELTQNIDHRLDYAITQGCQFKELADLFSLGLQEISKAALEIIRSQVRLSATLSDRLSSDVTALYSPMIERLQDVAKAELDASTISIDKVHDVIRQIEEQTINIKTSPKSVESSKNLEKHSTYQIDAELRLDSTDSSVNPSHSNRMHHQNHHFKKPVQTETDQNQPVKPTNSYKPNYSFMLQTSKILLGTMAGISLVIIALSTMDMVAPVLAVTIGLATVGGFTATKAYRFFCNSDVARKEESSVFQPDIKLD